MKKLLLAAAIAIAPITVHAAAVGPEVPYMVQDDGWCTYVFMYSTQSWYAIDPIYSLTWNPFTSISSTTAAQFALQAYQNMSSSAKSAKVSGQKLHMYLSGTLSPSCGWPLAVSADNY